MPPFEYDFKIKRVLVYTRTLEWTTRTMIVEYKLSVHVLTLKFSTFMFIVFLYLKETTKNNNHTQHRLRVNCAKEKLFAIQRSKFCVYRRQKTKK